MMQIGEKINKLTLVEYAGVDKYRDKMGIFKCECGVTKKISISHVKTGCTKSCGCVRKIKRTIKICEKINKLTLVEYAGMTQCGHRIGVFKCDCGNIKKIRADYVRRFHTTSCGCSIRYKRGWFASKKQSISIHYDSSYEEKALNVWENDAIIRSFNRSKDRITYVNPVDGSSHVYLPDFIVNDTRMIEIKPQYKLDDPVVQAKAAAAEAYCSERGMTYEIWTEHELGLIK